jgi:hypothetical protein
VAVAGRGPARARIVWCRSQAGAAPWFATPPWPSQSSPP